MNRGALSFVWQIVFSGLLLFSGLEQIEAAESRALDGEFWKKQALEQIAPYWQRHAPDLKNGAFYTALSRRWEPSPPSDKYPAMISRQVFGFCAAYLLSGEEQYLEAARVGAEYLLERAWDSRYGGWFDVLTESGQPKVTSKTVPLQLYTDVGLTLYFFVTGEEKVLARVKESVGLRKSRAKDAQFRGYFQALQNDLSVQDDSKSKHSHYGYASSLLVPLFLATRDAEVLRFAEELLQITRQRLVDREQGWVRGFPSALNRTWNLALGSAVKELVSPGAQLTAALVFLRVGEITNSDVYRYEGRRLAEQVIQAAWDPARGGWHDVIERAPPYSLPEPQRVSWWVQCYGSFVQLHLYHLTRENRYLEQFTKMASFWNEHFLDKEFGGVFRTVTPAGTPVDTEKAVVWKASYHEMEFGLLNYLYLNLYVNRKPAELHFHLRNAGAGQKHYVSLLEDAAIRIAAVTVNGKPWSDYDARERSVTMPEGDAAIVVTLSAP
ncbi:MAG: AGE family epimerase/isomerase [Verrucomicrobia bacterium]|nr:AGE family epimerase/isomerase [Verrucomicrobiota bacterium]